MKIADFDRWAREVMDFSLTDRSINGLQVGSLNQPLRRIAFALDACAQSFSLAQEADMLFVHHGLFWGASAVDDHHAMYPRIKQLVASNLALYAVHIPLDVAPHFGNNHALAQKIGLESLQPFAGVGVIGDLPNPRASQSIAQEMFAPYPYTLWNHHNQALQRIAIISGGGANARWIQEAIDQGANGYITGEVNHAIYHYTAEMQLNLIAGGHYWSEYIGLMRFAEEVRKVFPNLEIDIYDIPTGC
ncbi:Nif3-like dinuclear metal center hexameric protein [Entomospira culicis]|uniref:Nif3-like dinuclear metal center hexameric protein n=1 Tax=Entomospira culicis TaxID=2719989 RepID=A0A968KU36_9SPIO|nr:Nif3-like dinuclear metal center hexameric protein [Entomospira culicis]NIZ18894.1 Nif3-like dinuclear metal center hexameric protein [Entomospira culicis]NIZ69109.1 Nif3-like dinuclear metal center hexameric protein [Entomospira culicis]WDI37695.1 Nif3-like dinuclear metal center hexameric protein [Entomospira culicis]WDI39323.1 Nif3-like dinuclear metal center hexameric protein [Entomospira culicis]